MDPIAKYNAIVAAAQFNRPKKQLLHELIHVFLEHEIPLDKLTFEEAGPLDQRPLILTDPDSFVRCDIDPAYDYRFPGDNGFLYRRLPIAAAVGQTDVELVAPEYPFATWDMLDRINNFYSLALTPEDVYNDEYVFGDTVFTLRMQPGSWCWFGTRVLPVRFGIPSNARATDTNDYRVTEDTLGIRVIVTADS